MQHVIVMFIMYLCVLGSSAVLVRFDPLSYCPMHPRRQDVCLLHTTLYVESIFVHPPPPTHHPTTHTTRENKTDLFVFFFPLFLYFHVGKGDPRKFDISSPPFVFSLCVCVCVCGLGGGG